MSMPYIIIVAGVLNLAMGVLVLTRTTERKRAVPFALFAFTTFLWAVANFLIYRTGDDVYSRFAYSLGALLVTFLLIWVDGFVGRGGGRRWIAGLICLAGLIFTALPFVGDWVIRVEGSGIVEGLFYRAYVGYFLVAYLVVIGRLVVGYRRAVSLGEKRRTKIVIIGLVLYGALSLMFSLVLPLFGIRQYLDLDVPSSIIFVAFTTYAMVQYHWMNVRVILVDVLALVMVGAALQEVFFTESSEQRIHKFLLFLVVGTMWYLHRTRRVRKHLAHARAA
jgi:hypothetical protein